MILKNTINGLINIQPIRKHWDLLWTARLVVLKELSHVPSQHGTCYLGSIAVRGYV
jgi:hypothetical protein